MTDEASIDAAAALWGASGREALELDNLLTGLWETDETPSAARCLADARQEHTFSAQPSFLGSATGHDVVAPQTTPGPGYGTSQPHHLATNPAFLGQQHSLEGQQQQQQQQRQHATEPIMHRQYSNQAQQQQAVPSLASNAPTRLCGAQPHPLAHPPRQQPHAHAPPLRVGHDFVSGASHGGAAPGALLSAPSLPATPPATTNTPPDQPQPPTIPSDVGPTAASAQLSSLPCRTATWPAAAPAWGLTHQHTGVGELNGAGRGMGLGLRPGPGSGPDAQPFTPHCHAVAPHASANVHYHHPQQQQQHRHQLHSSRAKAQQDGRAGGPNCLQHANPAGDDPMALDPGATHTAVGALPAAPGSAAARPRPHPAHVTAATPFASAASQAAAAALPPEPWTHDATQQQQQQHVQQQAQQQQRPSADSLAQSGGAELRLPQLQAVPGQEAVRLPHAEGEEAASPSTARGLPQPYIHHPHPHPYARYASRLSHPHLPPPPHYPYPYPYPYAYPYSPYPPPHPRARPGYFPPPPVPPAPPPHPYPHPAVSPIKPPPTPHPYPYAPPARHPVSRNLSTGALPAPPFRPGPFPPPYLQPPAHPFAPSASPGTGPGPMRRVPSWHTGLSGAAAAAAVNNEQLSYHRNGQDQQQQQQDQGAVVAPYESHPSGLQLPPQQAAAEGQQQHEQQQQHQEQPLAGDAMVAAGQPGPRPRVHGGPARQAPPPSAFHHHHHLHHHHLQHDEGQLRRGSCGSSEGPASSSSGSSGPGGRQADRARAAAAATAGGSGSGLPVSPSNGAAHSGWLQGSSWALQGQGHAAAVAAALHPEALPQQPAPGLEAHPPGAPGPCQRPEQQQQQLAGAPAPGGALGVKPRSVSADGRQGPAMGLGPGLGPGGPPGLTRLGLQAMQQRGRHEQQPQPQHAGAKRLRVAFGIEEPDPDCDPLPDPGRGLGLGLLPPPPAPNAVPHGSGGGRDWWLAPAASAPLPDLPQQPSSSPSPPPAQPQSPSAPPQQPHLSSPPPQQSGAAPAQAHHSPKRQRTAAMRPSPSPSCSSLPSMDWALALPPPAQPPPPPPLHLQPLAATARTDVGLQMDMDVDMHMEIACMSAASAPAAAAGGCSSGPDGALTAAALEGFDADWALGLGLGGVEVSSLSCGGALPSVHAATGGAEGRAAGPPPASPSPPPSMPVLQTSGSAQPTPPPPPPPPPPLPLLQHERPTATVVQTGGPRLPETPAEQQQQQRKNSSAPKSKGVKVMVEEVQERADDALEGECGEEDAAGLPEPVQVTVVPATAACPEEEAILGTFHPAPYLAGKNCICVQRLPPPHVLAAAAAAGSGGGGRASGGGARLGGSGGGGGLSAIGGVGDFVSRSGFERLGGSIMAKWYRSIKVLPEGTPLGRWLTEQGLPVIKGGPRRARPHGSLRGAASANRAAAVARSSGGGGSRRGGSGGGKRSRRAAANRDTDDDTDSDLDE